MCIIVYKPSGVDVDKDVLMNCFFYNNDGAGFMYPDPLNKEVKIKKGFFSFASFYAAYQEVLDLNPNVPFILHFRITTHGNTDKKNCHPHRINRRLAVAHNGVLPIEVPLKSTKSDTVIFTREVLSYLPEFWYKNEGIRRIIDLYLGNNKLVLMNYKGKVTIFNESLGVWDENCWFSNTTYKSFTRYTSQYCHTPFHGVREDRVYYPDETSIVHVNKKEKKEEPLSEIITCSYTCDIWGENGVYKRLNKNAQDGSILFAYIPYSTLHELIDLTDDELTKHVSVSKNICEGCYKNCRLEDYDVDVKLCTQCFLKKEMTDAN